MHKSLSLNIHISGVFYSGSLDSEIVQNVQIIFLKDCEIALILQTLQ